MLGLSRPKKPAVSAVHRLYGTIVAQARTPRFHEIFKVADTIDGRFDLLVLHLSLVLERLKREGRAGADLAEALTTLAFAGFEEALRELGVGDFGMSRRIKAMANAFYGRYAGAGDDEPALAGALLRNLYRADDRRKEEAALLAHAIVAARRRLSLLDSAAILNGTLDFGPLP